MVLMLPGWWLSHTLRMWLHLVRGGLLFYIKGSLTVAPHALACILVPWLGSRDALPVLRALLQALRDAVSPILYS